MSPKLPKRRKSMIHAQGRGAAKALIAFAKEIRDDPSEILPDCGNECKYCIPTLLLDKLKRVSAMAGNKSKLDWASRWGDELVRGYASTLMLADEEEIPIVANLKLGNKMLTYAPRGHAKIATLAGLQNWHDPEARLLAYRKTAKKYGLSIYSTKESFLCTGWEPKPPKEFVEEVAANAGYDELVCSHKTPGSPVRLSITLANGLRFEVCEDCASEDASFAIEYSKRSLEKRLLQGAKIGFAMRPACEGKCDGCPAEVTTPVPPRILKQYLGLRMSDSRLLTNAKPLLVSLLPAGTIIAGGRCFGKDLAKLKDALKPDEIEALALDAALANLQEPLVISTLTVNKLLGVVWGRSGREVLKALGGDGAESMFNPNDDQPMATVREAHAKARKAAMHAKLPTYSRLGTCGKLADDTARLRKTKGVKAACDDLDRMKNLGHRENAISLAFYIAMGQEANRMWRFGKEEKDLGGALSPIAKRLLESEGSNYDAALKELLRMSGSGEDAA